MARAARKTTKTKQPAATKPAAPPQTSGPETWIGGSFTLPTFVLEGDTPYRPEGMVWMTEDGLIVGFTVAPPGDFVPAAVESFEAATRAPMVGPPRVPAHVRIDAPAIAEALRARLGDAVEIRVAATPELEPVLAGLKEHLAESDSDEPPTYLDAGIDAPLMASFFRTAAALHRAAPWKLIPSDNAILGLDIPTLGVRDGVVCVIGQAKESYGVLFYDSLADFEAYLDAAEAAIGDAPPERLSRLLALNFERRADLPAALHAEIAEHGWEVAGRAAYPWVSRMDADLVSRPPTREELVFMEALARALTELCGKRKQLTKAFAGGPAQEATVTAAMPEGPAALTLRAPHRALDE